MLIVFKSDDSINNRGFSLTYTAIDANEEEAAAAAAISPRSINSKHKSASLV